MDKTTVYGAAALLACTLAMWAYTGHPAALLFGACMTSTWVLGGLCRPR